MLQDNKLKCVRTKIIILFFPLYYILLLIVTLLIPIPTQYYMNVKYGRRYFQRVPTLIGLVYSNPYGWFKISVKSPVVPGEADDKFIYMYLCTYYYYNNRCLLRSFFDFTIIKVTLCYSTIGYTSSTVFGIYKELVTIALCFMVALGVLYRG